MQGTAAIVNILSIKRLRKSNKRKTTEYIYINVIPRIKQQKIQKKKEIQTHVLLTNFASSASLTEVNSIRA